MAGSNTAFVIGLQQNSCPAMLDANSGFSSIVPSGQAFGDSGSMTVSFSHGSFNGYSAIANYGPYSTPESIASQLAALITKNYHSSGLYAQAFGTYIEYKSNTTLGTASLIASGSSFMADPSPAACPPMNLTYVLAVTTDSVVWKLQPGSSGQQGRSLTYVLVKRPTADLPTNLFQRVNSPNSISEHFTKPGWMESTNSGTGEFDDVLGTASICPSCITGTDTNYRYFTATFNNQNLGTVRIYDKTGGHKFDYIQITHPSGPSILNRWIECKITPTPPNCDVNKPEDISLPNIY